MQAIYVPWLHMHQPLVWLKNRLISNLEMMLLSSDSQSVWNGKLIARAYKNPARYVNDLCKNGLKPRVMLDFSGILLEGLKDLSRTLKKTEINGEKIGDIIRLYKKVLQKYPSSIEFAGTAYSHCYFPVTPEEDWEWQIEEWKNVFKKLFGSKALNNIKSFWLPEMGIPGDKNKLAKLIKILKDFGYEWIILPLDAVEGEKSMSYEEKVKLTSQPHILSVKNQMITTVIKVKYDFIDQQAGCYADGVYDKCLEAARIFENKKPALVVPASDGENGNVMMNEFFPNTFLRFFKEKINDKVSSLTISQFLEEYYPEKEIKSMIKIKEFGSSWVGGHEQWTRGIRRSLVNKRNFEISKAFHKIKPEKLKKNQMKTYNFAKKLLLISETSCYTYWDSTFWFMQWERLIELLHEILNKFY